MKRRIKLLLVLLLLAGICIPAYRSAVAYWRKRHEPAWRTAAVKKGRVVSVVNATGKIKPVLSVQVGSFVSGPIEELFVVFNQADASVMQAEATLENAQANVGYTKIRAPVDGMVIDRKIDPGQTLAAQFQTPELFVVAPDLRKKVHVYASVDENDIGLIRQAQQRGQPVHFTVEAYPDDLFKGTIEEIRFSSTETQNVVTYPVIVAAPNPDLKLLPGMTASISFRVEEHADVLKIPNAALRFYPEREYVRQADRKLLEGNDWDRDSDERSETTLSAEEKAEVRRKRNRRHVWVVDGKRLKALEVIIGLSDSRFTEMVSGGLKEGQKVVTRMELNGTFGS